jgi:hypothetical protein
MAQAQAQVQAQVQVQAQEGRRRGREECCVMLAVRSASLLMAKGRERAATSLIVYQLTQHRGSSHGGG